MIDTAEGYGNEEQVGNGIKASGIDRKEIFITTKVKFRSYEHTREAVMSAIEKRRRLRFRAPARHLSYQFLQKYDIFDNIQIAFYETVVYNLTFAG